MQALSLFEESGTTYLSHNVPSYETWISRNNAMRIWDLAPNGDLPVGAYLKSCETHSFRRMLTWFNFNLPTLTRKFLAAHTLINIIRLHNIYYVSLSRYNSKIKGHWYRVHSLHRTLCHVTLVLFSCSLPYQNYANISSPPTASADPTPS